MYPQARQGGLSLCPSPPYPHRQFPQGAVWPIQAPNRKAHTAFSSSILPSDTVYMTSLCKPHPLNLFYSIVWYQSNLLTLIRERPQPPVWNMTYLLYISTCGHTQTHLSPPSSFKSLCWVRWQICSNYFLRFIRLDWSYYCRYSIHIFYRQTGSGQMSAAIDLMKANSKLSCLIYHERAQFSFSRLENLFC